MKKTIIFLCIILHSFQLFSQNKNEIDADYEIQSYFKNYESFNIDTLMNKKFNSFEIDTVFLNDCLSIALQRERDNCLSERIYDVKILFAEKGYMRIKLYKTHIFSNKNDGKIVGLINYNSHREKTNFYFDFEYLKNYIKKHNVFYNTKFGIKDFINQVTDTHYCGNCSSTFYIPPRYLDLEFDKQENVSEFRNWIKSFNIELQTNGVEALEYIEKSKNYKLTEFDKKIINNIKTRNSTVIYCSGDVVLYWKVFDKH